MHPALKNPRDSSSTSGTLERHLSEFCSPEPTTPDDEVGNNENTRGGAHRLGPNASLKFLDGFYQKSW